jgi:hypothetical protein
MPATTIFASDATAVAIVANVKPVAIAMLRRTVLSRAANLMRRSSRTLTKFRRNSLTSLRKSRPKLALPIWWKTDRKFGSQAGTQHNAP